MRFKFIIALIPGLVTYEACKQMRFMTIILAIKVFVA